MSCLGNPGRVFEARIFIQIPPSECWDLQVKRLQLFCFCLHSFWSFLVSLLRKRHCSAFPVSEEIFADKKSFFSLSCSPEWLRSSSEFLFLRAANPYQSLSGLLPNSLTLQYKRAIRLDGLN
jgi:hypothetical protein